jgi:hypothetical protein
MTTVENKEQVVEMTIEEWLAIRKEAGLKIDPETAEVCWRYAQVLDPYGVFPELAKEYDCVGVSYAAVAGVYPDHRKLEVRFTPFAGSVIITHHERNH